MQKQVTSILWQLRLFSFSVSPSLFIFNWLFLSLSLSLFLFSHSATLSLFLSVSYSILIFFLCVSLSTLFFPFFLFFFSSCLSNSISYFQICSPSTFSFLKREQWQYYFKNCSCLSMQHRLKTRKKGVLMQTQNYCLTFYFCFQGIKTHCFVKYLDHVKHTSV